MNDAKKTTHPARAMLRRDISLWLRILPGFLAFALIFGTLCAFAAASMLHGAESGYISAPVALVDNEDDMTDRMAVQLILSQDFTAPVDIVRCSAEEAEEGFENGSYSAVIYLTEGYMDDILTGRSHNAEIILSEDAQLHSGVLRLLSELGEDILSAGQYGVFAGENIVLRDYPDKFDDFVSEVNLLYVKDAMSDRWFVSEELSYGGTGVYSYQWYMLLYVSLFFSLSSLCCLPLGRDLSSEKLRRLRGCGIGDGAFCLTKLLLMLASSLLIALCAVFFSGLRPGFTGVLMLLSGLLVTELVGLSLIICLPGGAASAAVTALSAAALFAAGGIVPRMELSKVITDAAELLPLTVSARMFSAVFGAEPAIFSFIVGIIWCAAACIALKLRLSALRTGAET